VAHKRESHIRSIAKGFTWRLVGTLDTLIISWLVMNYSGTDHSALASKATGIALWDSLIKFALYYGHERLWQNIPLGVVRLWFKFKKQVRKVVTSKRVRKIVRESHTRSILKAISWRAIGTLTTIFVAYIITGDTSDALKIGGIEVFTKFLLYYLHERIWQSIPRGNFRKYFKK